MNCNPQVLRRAVLIITLLVVSCCLFSCKKKEEPAPASISTTAEQAAPAPAGGTGNLKEESVPKEKKRKIILNHSIDIEVKKFPVALEALTKLAESSGGYVFKSNRNSHDRNNSWGEVSIRVPANKAGSVLTNIRGLGRVNSENSSAEDITEGYFDLEARLKNARSSEARLSELYRKAGELADVLEVEKELTRVRGDIEAFEAKKKNWDLLTEMVTIEIHMSESTSGFPSFNRIWTPIKTAFGQAMVGFVDSLHSLIIILGAIIPWLAVFGPPVYFYVRKRRKKQQETISSDKTLGGESDAD
jgi:hypothetical protein